MKTDEELALAYQNGKKEAFNELVSRYQVRLFHFVGGTSDAMDLVQETFHRAHKKFHTFNPAKSFQSWIYTIARNCAIDTHRKQKSRMAKHNPLEDFTQTDCNTPEKELSRRENRALVTQAIEGLPEQQKKVLTLSYYQELSYSEIAQKLNCSTSTVKTHMSRAVRHLAKKLPRPEKGGLL